MTNHDNEGLFKMSDDHDTSTTEEQLGLFALPPATPKLKQESPMTKDWAPSPNQMSVIRQKNPRVDCDQELRNFRAYWRTKGVQRLDWVATYRNWLANAKLFEAESRLYRGRALPNSAAVESQT